MLDSFVRLLVCQISQITSVFFFSFSLPQAASCYRAAGQEDQAVAMYTTAGECQSHESVMAPASAAKDFKEAALITERQGR